MVLLFSVAESPQCNSSREALKLIRQLQNSTKDKAGNIRFICLYCDQNPEVILKNLLTFGESYDLTSLEHYSVSEIPIMGVAALPHLILVNKHGKIVYNGSPYVRRDLANDIDRLLNDRLLQPIPLISSTGNLIESEVRDRVQHFRTGMQKMMCENPAFNKLDEESEVVLTWVRQLGLSSSALCDSLTCDVNLIGHK